MPTVHKVRSEMPHFADVLSGRKTAELRLDDRGYQVGDTLAMHEFVDGAETGRVVAYVITHKLTGGPWLAPGYCMLSFPPVPLYSVTFD